jgi:hypothetical protein
MMDKELITQATAVLAYYRENPPTTEQEKLALELMVKEYKRYLETA